MYGVGAFSKIIESVGMPNIITIVVAIGLLIIAIKKFFGLIKILFPIAVALFGIKLLLSSYILSGILLLVTAYGIGSFVYK